MFYAPINLTEMLYYRYPIDIGKFPAWGSDNKESRERGERYG